jgi:hypothetical protein
MLHDLNSWYAVAGYLNFCGIGVFEIQISDSMLLRNAKEFFTLFGRLPDDAKIFWIILQIQSYSELDILLFYGGDC